MGGIPKEVEPFKNIKDIFNYFSEYMRISINYSMFSIVKKKVKMTSLKKITY